MKFSVTEQDKRYTTSYMGNPYIRMIEEKLNEELNNYCVECGNENPEYISINNGIFICVECVQNHLRFPKNISKIMKNNIKSLTLKEIQPLLCGGNKALLDFINNEFPKLSEFPPYILYRTQAMVYYRHNLKFLINGGVPPVKPSVKYAYKISNFNQNYNNNNIIESENDIYNTISNDKSLLNNINSSRNFTKFYKSGNNFARGRNMQINKMKKYDNRFANTINNIENNYDNYIINKPRQINFQNNNNIIIGNIGNDNDKKNVYSPQRIKVGCEQKNKRNKNKILYQANNNSINGFVNNINNVYIKPKLLLSPKINNNFSKKEPRLNKRTCSADIIKKNNNIQKRNALLERGQIINFQDNFNGNDNYLNKNFSQRSFFKNKNPINSLSPISPINYVKKRNYIHKSQSQIIIKNDIQKYNTYTKSFPPHKIDNSKSVIMRNKNQKDIFNSINNKICICDNIELQILQKKNNINSDKSNINTHLNKNNETFSTEETPNFSEIESLPIKINLKIDKKEKDNKAFSKKELKNSYSYNSKIKKIIKEDKNKNKIIKKSKDKNEEKMKNNLSKKQLIKKNCSQERLLKDSKINQKKSNENNIKNEGKITVSIRNKYKFKNNKK